MMNAIRANKDMPYFGLDKGDVVTITVTGNEVNSPSGLSWTKSQLAEEFKRGIWSDASGQAASGKVAPEITIISE